MSVHEMQKANRVKKTKAQKAADNERLLVAMTEQHDVLATFCDDVWQYEWQVSQMSVDEKSQIHYLEILVPTQIGQLVPMHVYGQEY